VSERIGLGDLACGFVEDRRAARLARIDESSSRKRMERARATSSIISHFDTERDLAAE